MLVPRGFRVCNSQHTLGSVNTTAQAGGPAQTITVSAESSQAHPAHRLDNVHHHLPAPIFPSPVPLQPTAPVFRPQATVHQLDLLGEVDLVVLLVLVVLVILLEGEVTQT